MRSGRAVFLLVLVGIAAWWFAVPVRAGDPQVAKLLFRKAEKAFRGKDYAEAAKLYQRVLEEHSPHPEAACGLGESLEKLGQNGKALQAFLQCQEQMNALEKPTGRQKSCLRRARKGIERLGKAYSTVDKRQERFVKDCLAFGGKHKKSAPGWAKRAYETVLKLDPKNAAATKALKGLGNVEAAGTGFGLPELLISQDSMSGWSCGEFAPKWSCKGRVISSDADTTGIYCFRSGFALTGSYRMTITARMVKRHGPDWYWGFLFGVQEGGGKMYSLCYGYAQDVYLLNVDTQDRKDLRSKPRTRWDPLEWHTLRVDVTPKKVRCFADGEEVFTYECDKENDFDGTVGLALRDGVMEFKDVRVYR